MQILPHTQEHSDSDVSGFWIDRGKITNKKIPRPGVRIVFVMNQTDEGILPRPQLFFARHAL